VSERLVVFINNTYDDSYQEVSTVKIMDREMTVSEWKTNDPEAILNQGIEAAEPNVFEQIRIKKMMRKAAELFQPTVITIQPKKEDD